MLRSMLLRALVLLTSFGSAACSVVLPTDGFTGEAPNGSSGNHEISWTRQLGDAAEQHLYALAVSSSGEVALGGDFGGPLDNNVALLAKSGEPRWGTTFGSPQ